ncbi:uncharacterized protein LOC123544552 [Mercenaria mercenaria]|uniref:uncharacterized protein LOC123544552 n=1 Tax=Mercenaria mercenaria TaxID=6596 RepID=UPI00234EC2C8|nr:uncharacterized protein LOC123544552 [Mercenaria mercenaria]
MAAFLMCFRHLVRNYFLFILIYLEYLAYAKRCLARNNCACSFDDGSATFNLSTIAREDGISQFHFVPSTDDSYFYFYSPCYPLSIGACTGSSACLFNNSDYTFQDIGDSREPAFEYTGENVVMTYRSRDHLRTTHVTNICKQDTFYPILNVAGETTPQTFQMEMISAQACNQ